MPTRAWAKLGSGRVASLSTEIDALGSLPIQIMTEMAIKALASQWEWEDLVFEW